MEDLYFLLCAFLCFPGFFLMSIFYVVFKKHFFVCSEDLRTHSLPSRS